MEKSIGTGAWDELRQLLRQLREQADLTQAQLAQRLNERQGFVSAYETGQRRLDIVELRQICEAIGAEADQFVKLLDAWDAATRAALKPRRDLPTQRPARP